MITKVEWMIALRYLRSKRKEGFISVVSAFSFIGIALGVATLIIVMAVMKGYEVELVKRILGINGHITISSPSGKIEDYEQTLNKIKNIKHVQLASPLITEQVMITGNTTVGAVIRGMIPEDIAHKPLLNSSIREGSLEAYQQGKGVLIGISLARKLRVTIGDQIKIIAPQSDATVIGSIPRMKTVKIAGIFDVGMYEYNATTIFVPLSFAQKFFQYQNAISDIEIMVDKIPHIDSVKSEIAASIADTLNIMDWTMANEQVISALKIERNVMFLILTMIIIVAAFNIISGLIMLVKEKTRNIAILRTIGLGKSSVIKIFIICGSLLGFIGTLIGASLGIAFSLNIEAIRRWLESVSGIALFDPVIYFLTQLPAVLDMESVISVVAMSLILSFLATIYPAYRAAKLMPAEALRYE